MTPEWKVFVNLCPKSALQPWYTRGDQIWRKSAVAKLPKSHLVLLTKNFWSPILAPLNQCWNYKNANGGAGVRERSERKKFFRPLLGGQKKLIVWFNCLAACTHLSSTVSQLFEPQVQKIAIFTYHSPHFSPGDAPAIITQYVPWMERQFNACQTPRSKYLSIFNSFRFIRCLSQCVSPKIAIFTT